MGKYTVLPSNPEHSGIVGLLTDIPFAAPDGKPLKLHLVKPFGASDGRGWPLVVFIQGSGWTKPDQLVQMPQLSRLAARGFAVASVTHRSSFEAPAPAFLQDVKAAVRFLRAHAAEYDIDKQRVCAWGTSSGGNTALLLGLTGDDAAFRTEDFPGESDAVQAVVDCFGPTDLMKMTREDYPKPPEDLVNCFYALGGGLHLKDSMSPDALREVIRERMEQVSPVCHVRPGRTLPPFLLLHGDADPIVMYEDSQELYEKLNGCGYEAELVRVTGGEHEGNFWSPALLERIFDFVQKNIG